MSLAGGCDVEDEPWPETSLRQSGPGCDELDSAQVHAVTEQGVASLDHVGVLGGIPLSLLGVEYCFIHCECVFAAPEPECPAGTYFGGYTGNTEPVTTVPVVAAGETDVGTSCTGLDTSDFALQALCYNACIADPVVEELTCCEPLGNISDNGELPHCFDALGNMIACTGSGPGSGPGSV